MPTIYDGIFEHEITPATEAFCLILSAMAIPVVLIGFGVYKLAEWVSDFWRKKTWRMRLIA